MGVDSKFILRDRNVAIIFSSQLVSAVCDKMMSIGLVWYITKNFSVSMVPWYLTLSFLPHLIFSFFTTELINRFTPLRAVLFAEFFRAAVLLMFAGSIFFFNLSGTGELYGLFICTFFFGIGSSIFNPAVLSLPPQVVSADKVTGLNALLDSSVSISTVVGAALGVVLLNYMNLTTLITLNAVSFIWAGLLQLRLKVLDQPTAESTAVESVSPRTTLKKYPAISRVLLSFLFINLAFTPILVFIPWIVQEVYHGTSATMSAMEGAMGLGAVASAVYYTITGMRLNGASRTRLITFVAFMFGVLFVVLTYTGNLLQGGIVLFMVGLLSAFLNIEVLSYFQTAVNEQEVPAIMTAVNLISVASIPLSMTLTGVVFPYVNVPDFAMVCGGCTVLISIFLPRLLQSEHGK